MNENGYSLSDIAAASNGEGFGGGSWWIIVLFLFAMMGGGFGFGGRDFSNYATAASQQEILFGQQFQNLDNKMDRLGNGVADATFALNNSVTNEGRQLQTQLANCCCSNKEAIAQVRYDMANFNAQQLSAIHTEAEATRNMIQQDKIAALQSEVSQLKTANAINSATAGVIKYPTSTTYAVASPCFNSSCGCNAAI